MHTPVFYEIRIEGYIGGSWSSWFEGLTIRREESGETVLSGPLADEAALHGVLTKVRDLGLPLVEVKRVRGKPRNTSLKELKMSTTQLRVVGTGLFFLLIFL